MGDAGASTKRLIKTSLGSEPEAEPKQQSEREPEAEPKQQSERERSH